MYKVDRSRLKKSWSVYQHTVSEFKSLILKAAKKHDRKRGHAYRVRPLMQVRLAELPFNKEDYSPLLFRINTMYTFTRQRLDVTGPVGRKTSELSVPELQSGNDRYHSFKCESATAVNTHYIC